MNYNYNYNNISTQRAKKEMQKKKKTTKINKFPSKHSFIIIIMGKDINHTRLN